MEFARIRFGTKVHHAISSPGGSIDLDTAVRKVLPRGAEVVSCMAHATATWTRAFRVNILLEQGGEKSYFLKCATGDRGRAMLEGEHASICEIAKYKPALTVVPVAQGRFEDAHEPTYFFLMEFLDIITGPGEPSRLCRELADLHATSVSPTGQFGFHKATYHGALRQDTTWEESWAKLFGRLLRLFLGYEMDANGPTSDGRYETEFEKLLEVTVDRLLVPLQSDGRSIKPCLVHGDLWHENVATERDTGQPKIFDASSLYAHHEYELGMWRRPAIKFDELYFKEHLRCFPPSAPEDQWDDRNRLYCIHFELAMSTGWAGEAQSSRNTILEHMVFLNEKYAEGNAVSSALFSE